MQAALPCGSISAIGMTLLTRDEFRNGVFARDNNQCVVCKAPAVDAHHIMERRLFDNGGYFLDNGVSVCSDCHNNAERTLISPAQFRVMAGITKIVLPSHLYPDYEYDKWGNIQNTNGTRLRGELFFDESVQKVLKAGGVLDKFLPYVKYPRTFHLPFSLGRTEDDRTLKDCSQFEGRDVVITEKLDGENTTGYYDGYIHARSLDSNNHPSRNWVKNYLAGVLHELPHGWRICGENLYAKHSIAYSGLKSYFRPFSIWNDRNECLSWRESLEWFELLNLVPVPVLYNGPWMEDFARSVGEAVEKDSDKHEGFVVRVADKFNYGQFSKSIAKFVRKNHVQTSKHWIKTQIVVNEL